MIRLPFAMCSNVTQSAVSAPSHGSRDVTESTHAQHLSRTRRLLQSGIVNGIQVSVIPLSEKPPPGAQQASDIVHKLRMTRARCDVITKRTTCDVRRRPLSAAALIDTRLLAVTGARPQSARYSSALLVYQFIRARGHKLGFV